MDWEPYNGNLDKIDSRLKDREKIVVIVAIDSAISKGFVSLIDTRK